MSDAIAQAVLARSEVLAFLRGEAEEQDAQAREQVSAYLEELHTTQRHGLYRALQHPLYPILRKIDRQHEHLDRVKALVRSHRIVYASNHKSHTDYLVEPLVLDDNGIRPPRIAAGINLFGGALGFIHRHMTGAIPIRRNTKDPAYLITLKAYVAELLKRQDLFFYPEGGRSYSGELKAAKTGLLHAALTAERPDLVIVPVAIAYDLVLEDHILSRQRVKKRQRPFTREVAEMVRYAVGYHSRAIVTFGTPIHASHYDAESKTDVLALTKLVSTRIGELYKVLPTALVATAMRPSITAPELESRIDRLIETLAARHANLDVHSGREAIAAGATLLESRGIIVHERGRFRIRARTVLRYYARTIEHLLTASEPSH